MEKIEGYKYNSDKFQELVMVTYDKPRDMIIEPTHPMGSRKSIVNGDILILSTDIKEGDFIIRFRDNSIGGDWFTGVCGRKWEDDKHVIFRDGISCGETRTQIWYKIVNIINKKS